MGGEKQKGEKQMEDDNLKGKTGKIVKKKLKNKEGKKGKNVKKTIKGVSGIKTDPGKNKENKVLKSPKKERVNENDDPDKGKEKEQVAKTSRLGRKIQPSVRLQDLGSWDKNKKLDYRVKKKGFKRKKKKKKKKK